MTTPLLILGILSLFGGFFGIPEILGGHHSLRQFLSPVQSSAAIELSHSMEWILMAAAVSGAVLMIMLAWFRFVRKKLVPALDTAPRPLLARLFMNKWYFDEVYERLIEKPLLWLSGFFHRVLDIKIIDGLVNGFGSLAVWTGGKLRYMQTGNIGFYLSVMVLAIVAILMYMMA
jgi:NADH-quinone oxidoreductase subunit L